MEQRLYNGMGPEGERFLACGHLQLSFTSQTM